jgi:small subunit ribosomal protein S11
MADEIAATPAPEQPKEASAPAEEQQPQAEAKRPKVKNLRHIPSGVAHVDATFNNTKVAISDMHGNTVAWCSAGRLGFKGSRKSTAYVAQQIGADAARRAAALGMREVEVRLKGPGAGRESAVRGIVSAGLEITLLKDVTPLPHNGCRPPKRRRV